MIFRNPKDYDDQWYVREEYFNRQYSRKIEELGDELLDHVLADRVEHVVKLGSKTLHMTVTLPNGYDVSATASPIYKGDFKRLRGIEACRRKIREKVRELLAFQMHGRIEL